MIKNRFVNRQGSGGFTLVELIVAMSIFIILLGVIVNIFIGSLRTQRTLVALRLVNDNISLAIEQMAREIRVAENFVVDGRPLGEGKELKFTSPAGDVIYKFNDTNKSLERKVGTGDFSPITSKNVKIKNLKFLIVKNRNSTNASDDWPPRITITGSVTSDKAELSELETNIQTTISGRSF